MRKIIVLVHSFSADLPGEPTVFEVRRNAWLVGDNIAIYVQHDWEYTYIAKVKATDGIDVYIEETACHLGYAQKPGESDEAYIRRIVKRMKRMSVFQFLTERIDFKEYGDQGFDIASDEPNADNGGDL